MSDGQITSLLLVRVTGAVLPMSYLLVIASLDGLTRSSGTGVPVQLGAPFNRSLVDWHLLSPIELYITPHGVGTWHRIISL